MDPEGDFYICSWKVKGVAGGACEALKKGCEDSAGGKGLAMASGMDNEILCIVLLVFLISILVFLKEGLDTQAGIVLLSQEP